MPKLHLRLVVDAEYDIDEPPSQFIEADLIDRLREIPSEACRNGLFTDDLGACLDSVSIRVEQDGKEVSSRKKKF